MKQKISCWTDIFHFQILKREEVYLIRYLYNSYGKRWNKWNVLRRICTKKNEKQKKKIHKTTYIYNIYIQVPYHFEICIGTVITHQCFCYTIFFKQISRCHVPRYFANKVDISSMANRDRTIAIFGRKVRFHFK